MAWRLEKNQLTEEPEYIFDGMENGIGDSPYTGIANMQGLNVKYYPKVAYSNIARTESTYTGGTGNAPATNTNYIVQDPLNLTNLYSLTGATTVGGTGSIVRQSLDSGKTWTIVTGNDKTLAYGNGLFILLGYLHVVSGTTINAIAINSGGTTGAWITMTTSITVAGASMGYAMVGRDIIAYICMKGNPYSYVASIIPAQNSGGATYDPNDPATFTWSDMALALPNVYGGKPTYLCELQTNLLVAVGNLIVPWDRTSTSYQIPFPFPEFISKMINVDNNVYCFGGVPTYDATVFSPVSVGRGNIYTYNGWTGSLFKKIPDSLATPFVNDPTWFIGGLMVHTGRVFFGAVSLKTDATSGGIYSLDVETGAINRETFDGEFFYTALCTVGNTLVDSNIVSYAGGYYDTVNARNRLNYTDQAGYRTEGIIETDILQVGSHLQAKTFNTLEVRFRNPLSTAEAVDVSIKKYFRGSVVSPTNPAYTAVAGNTDISFTCPIFVQNNEEIQVKLRTYPIQNGSGIPIKQIIIR